MSLGHSKAAQTFRQKKEIVGGDWTKHSSTIYTSKSIDRTNDLQPVVSRDWAGESKDDVGA